jgi:tetratricopeptide (TPR) repeat protein
VNRALALKRLGDFDGAIADCNRTLAIDPKHTGALVIRGSIEQTRGEVRAAMADFSRALTFAPEHAYALMARSTARGVVGDHNGALERIVAETRGYPYFLQEWGKHAWDVAPVSPIRREHIEQASVEAVAALDKSFFRVRIDRLTPVEKRYLRAMAELGTGPHRSGDIAEVLGRKVTSLGPTRSQLIAKGMIWSPNHGDTAFTVPLFDQFMRRIMPGDGWKTA